MSFTGKTLKSVENYEY